MKTKKSFKKIFLFKKYFILIIFILILYLIFFFKSFVKKKKLFKKLNNYIINCLNGNLIQGIKKSKLKMPKISSIIPSYNCSKTIKSAIRSIQNQIMSDIEIIIIDDHSKDNTMRILKKLYNEDKRIKIIRNKKNMGTLFTRSIGALYARGEYIMALDNDDLFIYDKIFDICYNQCQKYNIDIIEFISIDSNKMVLNFKSFPNLCYSSKYKKNNEFIKQPELSTYIYRKNKNKEIIKIIDQTIWGKCIKTNVYQKAVKYIGKKIYSKYIIVNEDRIVNFILFRIANSFKFIKKIGYLHHTKTSIVKKFLKYHISFDELFNINHIYKITKNSSDANICLYELLRFKNFFLLNRKNKKVKRLFNFIYFKLNILININFIYLKIIFAKEKFEKRILKGYLFTFL